MRNAIVAASVLAVIQGSSGESRLSPGLLFHEMVHVAQDAHLGPDAYMESYVRGWAELAARYGAAEAAFSVREEVAAGAAIGS